MLKYGALGSLFFVAASFGQDSQAGPAVAREIRAAGVEAVATGKFLGLRVEMTATTAGGRCSGWAMLSDQNHREIEFLNEDFGQTEAGRSTFAFKFQGAKIARSEEH